jgi:hypothetical protein
VEKRKFTEADFCIGIDGKYIERDSLRGFLGEFCDVKGVLDPRGSLMKKKECYAGAGVQGKRDAKKKRKKR